MMAAGLLTVPQVTLLRPQPHAGRGIGPQPGAVLKNAGMTATFRPEPREGRVFATRRIVRSTDVVPSGRLRLDSLARYLQTAAEDDVADSGLTEPVVWLVRRCELRIRALPSMGERLAIRTFCSGIGPRWAERTTTVSGPDGELVQASTVWAAVSRASGRPVPLSEGFSRIYGPSAGDHVVSVRLSHPRPGQVPADGNEATSGPPPRDWPLRATDFDTAGHVNNAVHWAAAEDELADAGWLPSRAEIEYHRAIEPGCRPQLITARHDTGTSLWLLDSALLLASVRLLR
jgi:acyl-ACP thioesterase